MNYPKQDISGVILSGGRGSRMGNCDKGLVHLNQRPLIEHVIANISPQVNEVIINANRNMSDYKKYNLPVIADIHAGQPGPLAGMAAALSVIQTPLLATVPCDSPFIPLDLVSRLYASLIHEQADLAVVHSQRLQPVFCLVKKILLGDLLQFLADGGRKIDTWHEQINVSHTDFDDVPDAFLNINSLAELQSNEQTKPAT